MQTAAIAPAPTISPPPRRTGDAHGVRDPFGAPFAPHRAANGCGGEEAGAPRAGAVGCCLDGEDES